MLNFVDLSKSDATMVIVADSKGLIKDTCSWWVLKRDDVHIDLRLRFYYRQVWDRYFSVATIGNFVWN